MPLEIEKKFLVAHDGWRSEIQRTIRIEQGYISLDPAATVRVRIKNEKIALLTIKGISCGISRAEYEYGIPLEHAREMLLICPYPLINKSRYEVIHEGFTWEVDVFEGANTGLVMAEIELPAADCPHDLPEWLGKEVSDDVAYFNSSLAVRPFMEWGS